MENRHPAASLGTWTSKYPSPLSTPQIPTRQKVAKGKFSGSDRMYSSTSTPGPELYKFQFPRSSAIRGQMPAFVLPIGHAVRLEAVLSSVHYQTRARTSCLLKEGQSFQAWPLWGWASGVHGWGQRLQAQSQEVNVMLLRILTWYLVRAGLSCHILLAALPWSEAAKARCLALPGFY